MTEIRTAIPEEVDAYLDALVQKGVFSNKAELVRSALVNYVNNTSTFFHGFDAETMFAPDGRLYQVEYARESAKRGGTAVGLVCEDGVLLAAEAVGKSKLSAGAKKIHFVSDRVALVASGLVGDADLVIDELQAATPKTTDDMIRTIRGTIHRFTLSRTQRPLGVAILVASMLDRKPRLVYVDPSGATMDHLATAMGRGATAALQSLESLYKKMRLADAERLVPSLFGEVPTELGRVSG